MHLINFNSSDRIIFFINVYKKIDILSFNDIKSFRINDLGIMYIIKWRYIYFVLYICFLFSMKSFDIDNSYIIYNKNLYYL